MNTITPDANITDAALLTKLNQAVAAANEAQETVTEAQETVTTAQAELVSRSKTVGLLLLEAKKLHPVVKDFEAFLKKRVEGLKLSRAYDLHASRWRPDDRRRDQEGDPRPRREAPRQQETAEANSGTEEAGAGAKFPLHQPDVTESTEASAERRKTEKQMPRRPSRRRRRLWPNSPSRAGQWLPRSMIEADRHKARLLVAELTSSKPKAEAA